MVDRAARPDTRNMLIVGVGGGVVLEGVPSSVECVDAIELEPEVIVANRLLAGMRAIDPLADPHINIVINDARNALRLTCKSYDAIVSQPSHPWTAGASHLFTREFAADVKDHLNDDSVFPPVDKKRVRGRSPVADLGRNAARGVRQVKRYRPTAHG